MLLNAENFVLEPGCLNKLLMQLNKFLSAFLVHLKAGEKAGESKLKIQSSYSFLVVLLTNTQIIKTILMKQ